MMGDFALLYFNCIPSMSSVTLSQPIQYFLQVDVKQHYLMVRLVIDQPDAKGQQLSMPAWMPGSYLIRDFAKHIVKIEARQAGKPVKVNKIASHIWQVENTAEALEIEYVVYAFEHSIRGAYADNTRVFFDGARVFLAVEGQTQSPHHLQLEVPIPDWQIATSMARASHSYPAFLAEDYEDLIDHPIQMGLFETHSFAVQNVPHYLHLQGRHYGDITRLIRDVKLVCEVTARLFPGKLPMSEYHFFLDVASSGYGGLEHRASTAMMCARDDLPTEDGGSSNYRTLLGLFSHEYFHTWWVKRIKPAVFVPYRLQQPGYTRLLWVFEGFTAYYDDLHLVRAGVISREQFLDTLANNITKYLQTPGRLMQSVADASFDTWIKFYKPDENTPNVSISYYLKGSLIALCLDTKLRMLEAQNKSLDNIVQHFWARYMDGKAGMEENAIEQWLEENQLPAVAEWLHRAVYSTEELPLVECFSALGIEMTTQSVSYDLGSAEINKGIERKEIQHALGMRLEVQDHDIVVAHVLTNSSAMEGGVCARDILVTIDGVRVTKNTYAHLLSRLKTGQTVQLCLFRDDILIPVLVQIRPSQAVAVKLKFATPIDPMVRAIQDAWLALS